MATYTVEGFSYTSIYDAIFIKARDSEYNMQLFRITESEVVCAMRDLPYFKRLNLPQKCCWVELELWRLIFPHYPHFPGGTKVLDGLELLGFDPDVGARAQGKWDKMRWQGATMYWDFTIKGLMLREAAEAMNAQPSALKTEQQCQNAGTFADDPPIRNDAAMAKRRRVSVEITLLNQDIREKLKDPPARKGQASMGNNVTEEDHRGKKREAEAGRGHGEDGDALTRIKQEGEADI